MQVPTTFDEIRPYHKEEVPAAIQSLLEEEGFIALLHQYFEVPTAEIKRHLEGISEKMEFQAKVIYPPVQRILKESSKGFTSSGFDQLDTNETYLYISNHRDIILDSALLNMTLYEQGFDTTQIAIGNNLLIYPWIDKLVRLNKSFVVHRNLNGRQQLAFSQLLSAYIRQTVSGGESSVWLAQKEGRTKDGHDATHPGLLKMLDISGEGTFAANFKALKIVPVSMSYEFDPCDVKKLWELEPASKDITPEEDRQVDLNNMVTGVTGPKGRIHFQAGTPIDTKLDEMDAIVNKNERFKALAKEIDRQIYANYRLYPMQYVAADLFLGEKRFAAHYEAADTLIFADYIEHQIHTNDLEVSDLRRKLVRMYAMGVLNHHGISVTPHP